MTTNSRSNELAERLRQRIKEEGPISFHDWMAAALYDPSAGYYCRPDRERWGRRGDYRTSPERSPLFAATFASYLARLYEELGSPTEWTIVEVGGGAGHFAVGVLEKFKCSFPKLLSSTRWVIDEISEDSMARAKAVLGDYEGQVSFQSLNEVDTINKGVVFANELLDAFPVHRLTNETGELREFYVGLNELGEFEWKLGLPSSLCLIEYLERNGIHVDEGQVAEISPEIQEWLSLVAKKLERGYVILVDYGSDEGGSYETETIRGSLRAFYQHHVASNVLDRVGEQDITCNVNWGLITRSITDLELKIIDFKSQDRFLLEAGILNELESLTNKVQDEGERLKLSTSAREMILPTGMAASFQVLVLNKNGGLEEDNYAT